MSQSASSSFAILPVKSPEDIDGIKSLFTDYTNSLGLDLTFQDYSVEFSSLPGKYSTEAGGALFLSRSTSPSSAGEPLGCVALRSLPGPNSNSEGLKRAEMKRLYTVPEARGLGLGKLLVQAVIQDARELGYVEVVLDTLESMVAARKLYESMGFREIEKYYDTPIPGTVFLGLRLIDEHT